MNMKSLIAPLIAGAFVLGAAGAAKADAMYYDMCAGNAACLLALTGGVDNWADQDGVEPDSGVADSTSEVFNQLAVHAETRTTQFDTDGSGGLSDGDKFSDFGHLNVTNIVPGGGGDNEGLNTIAGFQLTAAWSGLTGTASNLVPGSTPGTFTSNISYDAVGNTTFDFFVDDNSGPGTRTNFNYGASVSAADDNHASFVDGAAVLSVLIVGGFGTNTFDAAGNFLTGSSVLFGVVDEALAGFLAFEDGDRDFADLIGSLIKIKVTIDQNTDNVATLPCPGSPGCTPGALFVVDSDHDGSIEFVLVPEPASVLMFGLGFLALGGVTLVTRRRQA